jgi:polyhydroxyalkanoate synthesis regulator phasin
MNRKELEQIIKEELEEGFFSNMAAKLRGAKDGGWEAVAAQGDGDGASSKMAGAPSDAKIPVKELIGKLVAAGLPPDVSRQLFDEIIKQLKDKHGYGDAAIKEQAGALKGVAAQPSARTTSNTPSRKKVLDLDAVKIPKNMRKQVEQVLSGFFSKYGFTSVSLGQGPDAPTKPEKATKEEPQQKERSRSFVIDASNYSDPKDSSIQSIALRALGIEEYPNINKAKDKDEARRLKQKYDLLTRKIQYAIKKAVEQEIDDVSIQLGVSESLDRMKVLSGINKKET